MKVNNVGWFQNGTPIVHINYQPDTGCEIAPSCLNCPLPQCRYDEPHRYSGSKHSVRRSRILALLLNTTDTIDEIAIACDVTPRTVYRIQANHLKHTNV